MPTETMTPRERWLAVLQREKPDRIPMDYWATGEATEKLMAHLGVSTREELYARLHIDAPAWVGPRYVGPAIEPDADAFGRRYRYVDYGTGRYQEVAFYPLAQYQSVDEIEANYRWPSIDWYDYSDIADQVAQAGERPIMAAGSSVFYWYCDLRGVEQGLLDLALNPEIARYCIGRLFDHAYEDTARTLEAGGGRITAAQVTDDFGSQEDLLLSPAQIEGFLFAGMKRMIDLLHSAGAYAFHHDDGAIRKILPRLVDLGIDILNPVQWRCSGMEREGLKRDFGDRVVFHGGVDNQHTLPFGSVADVRKEVSDNIRILGAGGGYILAPCHNIQAVSPPENVVAMYETGYEEGWAG